MQNKIVILAIWAIVVFGLQSNTYAQQIGVTLVQSSDNSGNTRYWFSVSTPFNFRSEIVVISPSGARFDRRDRRSMTVSTFEEIQSELFGSWTVEDIGLGDEVVEIHSFTIEPFGLNSVFSEIPFVVAPSDGDTVQTGFVFDWEYADGVNVTSAQILSVNGRGQVDTETTFDGTSATIDTVLAPGITSAQLTISTGTADFLFQFMSPITTTVDEPRSSFFGSLRFENVTDPITVTVESGPVFPLGDVNLDNAVTFLDISPFISLLSSGDYQLEADIDQNGMVNFLDIIPFIDLLSAG